MLELPGTRGDGVSFGLRAWEERKVCEWITRLLLHRSYRT